MSLMKGSKITLVLASIEMSNHLEDKLDKLIKILVDLVLPKLKSLKPTRLGQYSLKLFKEILTSS